MLGICFNRNLKICYILFYDPKIINLKNAGNYIKLEKNVKTHVLTCQK